MASHAGRKSGSGETSAAQAGGGIAGLVARRGSVEERLEALFKRLPANVFGLKTSERHARAVEFIEASRGEGIGPKEAMKFLKRKRYEWRISNWQPRDKNQVPELLMLGNTSEVGVTSIVTGAPKCKDGVQTGGVFGPAINVRKDKHLPSDDLTPIAYIINHFLEHGHALPPYLWVLGEYDASQTRSPISNLDSVARLAIDRLENFKKAAREAGFLVSGNELRVYNEKTHAQAVLPLLAVVYNSSDRSFMVVKPEGEGIGKMRFEDFVAANDLLRANSIAARHVENMRQHQQLDEHYHEYHGHKRFAKTTLCVDSRSTRPDSGGAIKVIGSVLLEEEFVRIAKDSALDVIEIDFHVPCGYFSSAIALHRFFKELSEKLSDAELREIVLDKIERVMSGKRVDLDAHSYAKQIGLSHASEETFLQLFGARGDLRKILRHMYKHGVFSPRRDGFAMRAAASVDAKLAHWKVTGLSQKHYALLVVEEFARGDQAQKAVWLEKHRREI